MACVTMSPVGVMTWGSDNEDDTGQERVLEVLQQKPRGATHAQLREGVHAPSGIPNTSPMPTSIVVYRSKGSVFQLWHEYYILAVLKLAKKRIMNGNV